MKMKNKYRMFLRGKDKKNPHNGVWWCQNNETGKQESLKTKDKTEAVRLLAIRNQPHRFSAFNLQLARTHMQMSNPELIRRTWQDVMDDVIQTKRGRTKVRYERASKDKAFDSIRNEVVIETTSDALLDVMAKGTVSTNVYLRRWHNFALDMNWLLVAIIPKKRWPAVAHKDQRGITLEEHQRIVAREQNSERKAFYQLCWLMGGSRSDVAELQADNLDWSTRTLNYVRKKSGEEVHQSIGPELENLLRSLPKSGYLFPYLARVRECDRATEFKQRCKGLGISGVTLHSYRYAWAERARTAGYPERFAQDALGHNSKAVHRAYAKKAQVLVPSLEDYEKTMREKIVPFQPQAGIGI